MYAHYFSTKADKFVILSNSPRVVTGNKITVSGKAEARKVAKQHNAQPWNY